jgi:molybdopterin converting factor small subunit
MAVVYLPKALRNLSGGNSSVVARGKTVREVFEDLDRQFPGIHDRLFAGSSIQPGLMLAVGSRMGARLLDSVDENDEIHILPAIGGG